MFSVGAKKNAVEIHMLLCSINRSVSKPSILLYPRREHKIFANNVCRMVFLLFSIRSFASLTMSFGMRHWIQSFCFVFVEWIQFQFGWKSVFLISFLAEKKKRLPHNGWKSRCQCHSCENETKLVFKRGVGKKIGSPEGKSTRCEHISSSQLVEEKAVWLGAGLSFFRF